MPTGYRMLAGNDLEGVKVGAPQMSNFLKGPDDILPSAVYIQGRQTPIAIDYLASYAPLDAQIESAWLDGDDETVKELMEARARLLGKLAL